MAFKDNLLAQNQLNTASSDLFALLNNRIGSESERNTVVSSANDNIFSVVLLEMSCMYKRKMYLDTLYVLKSNKLSPRNSSQANTGP